MPVSPRIERPKWELSMQRRRIEPIDEFKFDPPLMLQGNLVVATLAEAAAFTRSLKKPRLPKTKATVLRWLERATDEDQQRKAANMFRIWAESEGVLLQSR
jgi:hypothetical protein